MMMMYGVDQFSSARKLRNLCGIILLEFNDGQLRGPLEPKTHPYNLINALICIHSRRHSVSIKHIRRASAGP